MGDGGNAAAKNSTLCVFPSSCFHLCFAHEKHKMMEPVSRHGGGYSL